MSNQDCPVIPIYNLEYPSGVSIDKQQGPVLGHGRVENNSVPADGCTRQHFQDSGMFIIMFVITSVFVRVCFFCVRVLCFVCCYL